LLSALAALRATGYCDFSFGCSAAELPLPLGEELLLPAVPLGALLLPAEPLPLIEPELPALPPELPALPPELPALPPELPPTDDEDCPPSSMPSAAVVCWSSWPEVSRPSFFWNSFSAACVFGPMMPSTCTLWPFSLSFCCTCFTVSESWLLAWDCDPEEAPADELGDEDVEAPADELGVVDWLVLGVDDCVSLLCDWLCCPAPAATALPANIAATKT
jgi:hypothetical protein